MHHLIYLHWDFYLLIYCPLTITQVFCSSSDIIQPLPGIPLYRHQTLPSQCSLLFPIYMNILNRASPSIVTDRTLLSISTLIANQLFLSLPLNQLFINTRSLHSCSVAVVSLSALRKIFSHKLFTNTERLYEPNSLYSQFKAGLLTKKTPTYWSFSTRSHLKKHPLILSSVFINWHWTNLKGF